MSWDFIFFKRPRWKRRKGLENSLPVFAVFFCCEFVVMDVLPAWSSARGAVHTFPGLAHCWGGTRAQWNPPGTEKGTSTFHRETNSSRIVWSVWHMKAFELGRLSFGFCLSVSVTNNFLSNFSSHFNVCNSVAWPQHEADTQKHRRLICSCTSDDYNKTSRGIQIKVPLMRKMVVMFRQRCEPCLFSPWWYQPSGA